MKKLILILTLMSLFCCKKNTSEEPRKSFDKSEMLTDIYSTSIAKFNTEFNSNTFLLDSLIRTFRSHTTLSELEKIRGVWKQTISSWKKSELYDFTFINKKNLHNSIDKWPVNKNFLDVRIADSTFYTEALIEQLGSTVKGIHALEYILFRTDDNEVIQLLTFPKSHSFVAAIASNLHTKSSELISLWKDSKQGYVTNLSNDFDGSINQLVNNQVRMLERMLALKLGKPMGKSNGGSYELDKLESGLSEESFQNLKDNFESLKLSYYGGNSLGIKNMLTYQLFFYREYQLAVQIDLAFNRCNNLFQHNSQSLKWLLINNPDYLDKLHESLRELLILFKVDLSSRLSVLLTFNDNDGD